MRECDGDSEHTLIENCHHVSRVSRMYDQLWQAREGWIKLGCQSDGEGKGGRAYKSAAEQGDAYVVDCFYDLSVYALRIGEGNGSVPPPKSGTVVLQHHGELQDEPTNSGDSEV